MNNPFNSGMMEAVRLTREGRLDEATARIQQALGGAQDVIDVVEEPAGQASRVQEEAPPAEPFSPVREGFRRPPAQPRGFRGMTPPSGLQIPNMPLTMPGSPGSVVSPVVVPEGARFLERSYANRAGGRDYKLYVPSGYTGQEVMLVVMLHGCTQNPDDFATGTLMNALAEEHTFLVAYPAQTRGANTSGCWNWFKAADQRRGEGEPSIIAGITAEVLGEYNVSPGKVYVAGMSAGGAMAAVLGATYPDLYAAVGVHSGLAPGAARDLPSAFAAMQNGGPAAPGTGSSRSVPLILFHGDRDTTVNPRNADHLLAHASAGTRAGADGQPPLATVRQGKVADGHSYTRATHRDADGRAIVERWTVHGLGHAWSGGSALGSYTDPKGPGASAALVRFFQQHSRR
jgi:poly(hydroxyalkanoate) depolymerase family esterase